MQKATLLLCLLWTAVAGWAAPRTFTLSSPDRNYEFTLAVEEDAGGATRLYYTLTYKGKTVVGKSRLGVDIENKLLESALGIENDSCAQWGDNLSYIGSETGESQRTWQPLYGERSNITDHYRSLRVKFRKGEAPAEEAKDGYDRSRTYFMDVEARAYNEGVAFRYHFPATTNGLFLHITRELTEFALPEGTLVYYEAWAQSPVEPRLLNGWEGESERPLTMILKNGLTVALGEARMRDYVRTKFALSPERRNTLVTSMYDCADVITPYDTPWRVVMAAERPVELIAHDYLYLNLNDPCALQGDLSWIRPGKAFRSALKQKDALTAVDFAAERGLQYVHLDAGWYGPEMMMASDASRVAPDKDLDIPALCGYAASKGIGVWLYVNQRALVQQLDSLLPLYKEWGVKGLKFGFVQVGNQFWTIWLHQAVRRCAEYGLMVDIHDEYRSTGLSRTLPNLMTQEGVHGNEMMPDARHNTTLPFTRFLCGPADYTPCYFSSRVKNTHAHQLALPVVYYSPVTFLFWYDTPQLYRGEKELEFWKHLPCTWDDTVPIDGQIGEYVAIARRSGKRWFTGVLNGTEARTLTLPTRFLEQGKAYRLTLYEDNPSLDTRTKVAIVRKTIKGGDDIVLKLQASGGAAMEITPVTESNENN